MVARVAVLLLRSRGGSLRGLGRLSGGSGCGGRGRRGGRGGSRLLYGCGGLFRFLRGSGLLGMVNDLIGAHKAGACHAVNGGIAVRLLAEAEKEAVFRELCGGCRVALHVLGQEFEIILLTEGADLVDQHEGAQVFHAAALIEKDLKQMRITGNTGRTGRDFRVRRRSFFPGGGLILAASLNLLDKAINFLK